MPTDNNALTEIALALVMVFFTLLVLAMLTAGASLPTAPMETVKTAETVDITTEQKGTTRDISDKSLLIYYEGSFYSDTLEPLSPQNTMKPGPLILAVAPDLPLTEVLDLQRTMSGSSGELNAHSNSGANLSITTLNPQWIEALEARGKTHAYRKQQP